MTGSLASLPSPRARNPPTAAAGSSRRPGPHVAQGLGDEDEVQDRGAIGRLLLEELVPAAQHCQACLHQRHVGGHLRVGPSKGASEHVVAELRAGLEPGCGRTLNQLASFPTGWAAVVDPRADYRRSRRHLPRFGNAQSLTAKGILSAGWVPSGSAYAASRLWSADGGMREEGFHGASPQLAYRRNHRTGRT
jgi:hypothetical protein